MILNTNTEWARIDNASVLSQLIDEEVFIIDIRLGNYYSLSGVSAAIWEALRSPRRLEELVQLVQQD
ncbi:MAG: PqqD family protein, partial [Burkholderiales bacterium]|nr:PqqD family protein [Anaerolineae bacterium]